MTPLTVLSILKLSQTYIFHLQRNGPPYHTALLTARLDLSTSQETFSQEQIDEKAQLLNHLIVHRHLQSSKYKSSQDKDSPLDQLLSLGRLLYKQLIPPSIQHALQELPSGSPFIIASDEPKFPWELLHDGENYLALKFRIARQLCSDKVPPLSLQRDGGRWKSLLIGDPTEDLGQADDEIDKLSDLIETIPDTEVPQILMRSRATKAEVIQHLSSGEFDLIHYSGHAIFDQQKPDACGLLLAGGEILTAAEIERVMGGQPVVFLNGCESARGSVNLEDNTQLTYLGVAAEGLATAFIRGGAKSFIGTFWPVYDATSQRFALSFYRTALKGETLGESIYQARSDLINPVDPLWASYTLYGDPTSVLIQPNRSTGRPSTILVARLLGLDTIHDHIHPEQATTIVKTYISKISHQISQSGGHVENLAHDILICRFGSLQTQEYDAERATHAALEIRGICKQLNSQYDENFVQVSVGLSSGEVWLDTVSAHEYHIPLLTGKVVQDATWLANQAGQGQILVAESTRLLIKSRFKLEAHMRSSAPDRRGVYGVLERLPESELAWQMVSHQTAMISRTRELHLLQELCHSCCQGQGQIVDIIGEAGIGKSRLLYEFHRQIEQGVHEVIAICPSAYDAGAYWLVSQLLHDLLGLQPTDDEPARRDKIRNVLSGTLIPSTSEQEFHDILAILGDILAVTFPDLSLGNLEPQIVQILLIRTLAKLLGEKAADSPVILVLEDVQRADTPSLEVIKKLATKIDRARIMIVALARPKTNWQSPWQTTRPNYHLIQLRSLNEEDSQALLATLLDIDLALHDVPNDIVQVVLPAAAGNPFFMRELIISYQEANLLSFEAGRWRLTQAFDLQNVPTSIERLIRTRTDALPEDAQRILPLMAVLGDRCEYAILKRVVSGMENEHSLDNGLSQLEEREFIQSGLDYERYHFTHTLIQSIIYRGLRSEERRRYHRRIGQAIEQIFRESEAGIVELLAHHYYQSISASNALGGPKMIIQDAKAKDYGQAANYLEKAGEQANRRLDLRQALLYYGHALQVAPRLGAKAMYINYYEGLGDAYDLLGEFKEAIAAYKAALKQLEEVPESSESRCRSADLARRIGRGYGWQDNFSEAHSYMQRALQNLGELHSTEERRTAALIHIHTGSLYYLQRHFERVEQECRDALKLLEENDDGMVKATALKVLGVICQVTGRWEEAEEYYIGSRDISEKLNHRHHLAEVTDNLGSLYFYRGEFTQAAEIYQKNLDFWQQAEATDSAGYALMNLACVYHRQGKWSQSLQYYQDALAAFEQSDNPQKIALTHTNWGFLELDRGNYDEAKTHFQTGVTQEPNAENLRGRSEAELNLGNLAAALNYAQQSLEQAQNDKQSFEEGVTLGVLGSIAQALDKFQEAQHHYEGCLHILHKLDARYEVGRLLHHLAQFMHVHGHHASAQQHLQEAIQIFDEVGAQADLAQAHKTERNWS